MLYFKSKLPSHQVWNIFQQKIQSNGHHVRSNAAPHLDVVWSIYRFGTHLGFLADKVNRVSSVDLTQMFMSTFGDQTRILCYAMAVQWSTGLLNQFNSCVYSVAWRDTLPKEFNEMATKLRWTSHISNLLKLLYRVCQIGDMYVCNMTLI